MPESWWLKVKRAQKHMVDIERAAKRYASRHPYELTRIQYADHNRKVGYRVRITEQPDPMIAIMLGDFVHNLRSALDHIVVACVPKNRRRSAGFPIVLDPIWDKDTKGEFALKDDKARKRFVSAIEGLPEDALAIVERVQPYHSARGPYRDPIGIISRLENADKHRYLILVGGGVKNLVITATIRNKLEPGELQLFDDRKFAKDNTVLSIDIRDKHATDGKIIRPSEVDLQFIGTAKIFINMTRPGDNQPPSSFELCTTMLKLIQAVRRLLRRMEPFVVP